MRSEARVEELVDVDVLDEDEAEAELADVALVVEVLELSPSRSLTSALKSDSNCDSVVDVPLLVEVDELSLDEERPGGGPGGGDGGAAPCVEPLPLLEVESPEDEPESCDR